MEQSKSGHGTGTGGRPRTGQSSKADRSTGAAASMSGSAADGMSQSPSQPATGRSTHTRHRSRTWRKALTRAGSLTQRDVVVTSFVSLGLCVGVVLVADGLHSPKPPPQPTAAQAFQVAAKPADNAAKPKEPDRLRPLRAPAVPALEPLLPPAKPTRVRIGSISVNAPLMPLSLDAQKHLVPPPDQDRNLAGWYQGAATPGALGTAVIAGHVDNHQGPAVFYNLGALKKNDTIAVDRADGVTAVFTVDAVEAYGASAFPTDKVYSPAKRSELRIITCGAGFDKKHDHYMGNVVVYAHLTSTQPKPA